MLTPGTRVRTLSIDSTPEAARALEGKEGVVLEGSDDSIFQVLLGMVPVALELTEDETAAQEAVARELGVEYKGYHVFWADELEEIETPVGA